MAAHVVPRLGASQIAQLRTEGFVVLPAALDAASCARVREQMWSELTAAVPRIRPDDPSTWTAFTDAETPTQRRTSAESNNSFEGGDPRLVLSGGRFNLQSGCDALQIETFALPLWDVAEQVRAGNFYRTARVFNRKRYRESADSSKIRTTI